MPLAPANLTAGVGLNELSGRHVASADANQDLPTLLNFDMYSFLAKLIDALRLPNEEYLHLFLLWIRVDKAGECLVHQVILLRNVARVHLLAVLFHGLQLLFVRLYQLFDPLFILSDFHLLLLGLLLEILVFGDFAALNLHELCRQVLYVDLQVASLFGERCYLLILVADSLVQLADCAFQVADSCQ